MECLYCVLHQLIPKMVSIDCCTLCKNHKPRWSSVNEASVQVRSRFWHRLSLPLDNGARVHRAPCQWSHEVKLARNDAKKLHLERYNINGHVYFRLIARLTFLDGDAELRVNCFS